MVYALLKVLLKHALQVFFRRLEVVGAAQVPASGPLLLASNHPNTLIDVLLVGTCLERRVGFVAKATLFKGLVGAFFRFMGAVPVSRRQDGAQDEQARRKNAEALAACEAAVAQGQAVLIFPEGVSQADGRLKQLRTGLARIALGAARRTQDPVCVVPVSLNYDDPGVFRSRVRVTFGAPLQVGPYQALAERLEAEGQDSFQAVRSLTEAVRQGLLEDTVHVDEDVPVPLLRELDLLYGDKVRAEVGSRLAATAALARALNDFAAREPERVAAIEEEVAAYLAALEAAGVEDYALRVQQVEPHPTPAEDLAYVLGAPLAWWGILNHLVYYQIPRLTVRLLKADQEYASTIKLLGGLLALAACYALQTWGVWALAGQTAALVYLGTLPLAGMVALLWLEGFQSRRRARRALAHLRSLPPEVRQDLTARRQELIRKLDQGRAEYLARNVSDEGREASEEEPW